MPKYIDGFLIPLAKDKIEEYRALSSHAGEIWMELGALEYYECIGDDLDIKDMVSFRHSAGATAEETVVFSFIVYASREDRNRINAAIMADPRINELMEKMGCPFDPKRMAYGGFQSIVSLMK